MSLWSFRKIESNLKKLVSTGNYSRGNGPKWGKGMLLSLNCNRLEKFRVSS